MSFALRAAWHLARADYLQRVRRHGFLVTLGFALWFAYVSLPPQDSIYVTMRISGARGIYNSAWVGMVGSLMTSTFLSIAGFYLVKNAIERDRTTGVGQILATTPMTKPLYTLGKTASNFAVLATIVVVAAVAAGGVQLLRGEDRVLDPGALVAPFVLGTLPVMAVVAGIAVLFEALPGLSGGLGNVAYFFLWSALLVPSIGAGESGKPGNDLLASAVFMPSVFQTHAAAYPDSATRGPASFSMGFNFRQEGVWHLRTFRWPGIDWTPSIVAGRIAWAGVGIAIALVAAIPFDRFDPARWRRRAKRPARRARESREDDDAASALDARGPAFGAASSAGAPDRPAPAFGAASSAHAPERAVPARSAADLTLPARAPHLGRLAVVELRLLLRGVPRIWMLVALGLVIAESLTPIAVAREWILPFAWIWPLLLWSGMGAREERHGTAALVLSSPRPLAYQLPAAWLAGSVVAAAIGAPVAIRLALAGDTAGLAAWTVGAAFIPSMALALGVWTGSGKMFEILYLTLWYAGPINRIPFLDYIGGSPAVVRQGTWIGFAMATGVLMLAALFGRYRQLLR